MNDALRYRMLRQLVDYPDQMDADLDELIREAIEDYRATAQPGAKPNENRVIPTWADILNRAGLGLEVMHERNAHNFPLDLASVEATPVALTAPTIG